MANQGIIHLAHARGGRPYCNSRRAIMSTTEQRIIDDKWGWDSVCKKCNAIRLHYEAERNKRTNPAR